MPVPTRVGAVLAAQGGMFAHVLAPIDLSQDSARCLDVVKELAARRVTVLHVIQRVPGLPAAELRPFYARLRQRADKVAARAAAALNEAGLRVSRAVTIGDPAREIVRFASARRVDLVVLGSHSLGRRPGEGFGTTSYKVALVCSCPVLLVK